MDQDNMINIIEEMQMVGHKGGLCRETILNGYFCSNYALICVDGRCNVDSFSRLQANSDWWQQRGGDLLCSDKATQEGIKGEVSGSRELNMDDLNVTFEYEDEIS